MKNKKYSEFLNEKLNDPKIASEYLTSALSEGTIEEFLLALKSIADSHGGISNIAEITELNRQNMYKMLSEEGNPTIKSLNLILKAMGIKINFEPEEAA